jgi:hypothetical protein
MTILILGTYAIGYPYRPDQPDRDRTLEQSTDAATAWERDLERVGTYATSNHPPSRHNRDR